MKKHNKLRLTMMSLTLLFFGIKGYAQNPIWSLAPNYVKWINNQQQPPTPLPIPNSTIAPYGGYTGLASITCSNAMADAQGNLSFFVLNSFLYDALGREIGQMVTPNQDFLLDGGSELCIIPKPGVCNQYYVFGSTHQSDIPTPSYQDHYPMYLEYTTDTPPNTPYAGNNYTGSVSPLNNMYNNLSLPFIPNSQPGKIPESYFAASPIRNDNSHLLFVEWGNLIGRYRVDAQGVTFEDTMRLMRGLATDMIPFGVGNGYYSKPTGELELHLLGDGTYLLATSFPVYRQTAGTYSNDVLIYHLDASGDLINNDFTALSYFCAANADFSQIVNIKGLEFSPDGSKLYIAHSTNLSNYPNAIEYYDFNNPTAGIQSLSLPNDPNYSADDYQSTQIELGQDGKLYFTGEDANNVGTANRLSTLSSPNTPNSINWNYNAQTISYTATYSKYQTQDIASKIYPLPDQIDGMDYDARFTQNLQCCLDSRDYGMTTYNASGTDVWNSASDINGLSLTGNTVTVQNELRIKAGTSITIKNMIFKFAPGARVIIDKGNGNIPGGKLTMDNTVFTVDDDCDINNLMWLGVQVWGDAGAAQIPTNNTRQGQLIMQNNSVIEYAQIGAMASKRFIPQSNPWLYSGQPYDNNYNGGIIIAENSSFHNNLNDVEIRDYTAPAFISGSSPGNRSVFNNCHFYTDNYLIHLGVNYNVGHHVELRSVQAVNFYGCDFENTVPQLYNTMSSRGDGIIAYNSKFSVDNLCGFPCVNPDFSEFKNLYSAINAASSNGLHTALVNKAKFYNNPFGITLSHINIATITSNYFEVSPSTYTLPVTKTYGLYMTKCTGYHVENNYFTHYNDINLGHAGTSYGIVVDNSGPAHNEIYRNTFIDLRVGVQAQNTNSSYYYNNTANAAVGLQILCNTFKQDMSLADITVSSGSIDYQQGFLSNSANSLAGNIFSHSHHNEESDFMMGMNAKFLNYSYNPTPSPFDYTPLYYTHQTISGQLSLSNEVFLSPWNNSIANTCPSRLNWGITVVPVGVPISVLLQLKRDSLSGVIAEKESLFDGGNTSDLLGAIATQSSGNLKNTLMNASPYLTDTVLSGYLGINPPNALLKQVVIANSPVSSKIAQVIDNMNLPYGIQKQIDNAQTGISARRYLEGEIAYSTALKTNYFYEHIRLFLFDTISPSPMDSIAEIVKRENLTDEMRKLLFASYEQMPDSGRASTQRQEIITAGTCQHFEEMSSIELQLLSVNSIGDAINSDTLLKAQLNSIAGCTDACCSIRATCMLLMAQDSVFIPLIEDIEPLNSAIGLSNNSGSMESNEAASALSVYPNPTNNGTIVTIALDSKDETLTNARIEVYNITGQLMLKQAFEGEAKSLSLQPGALHPGVYFVKLISEGTIIETKKLLVER